jgi:hypothetical protein
VIDDDCTHGGDCSQVGEKRFDDGLEILVNKVGIEGRKAAA